MPTFISTLANRVLWDGDGAISFRDQKQLADYRNPSIVGDSSVAAGDEWSVVYLREESFQQLVNADKETKKSKHLKWINRFRRHRVYKHESRMTATAAPSSSTSMSNNDSTNKTRLRRNTKRPNLIVTKGLAKEENLDENSDKYSNENSDGDSDGRPDLCSRLSVRTTRKQADGTSLLQKQHAQRFNNGNSLLTDDDDDDDDESIARSISNAMHDAHLVRKISELTLGSRDGLAARADWGDPLMGPLFLFGSYDTEDDDDEEEHLFLDDNDDLDVFSIASDPGSMRFESDLEDMVLPMPMLQRVATDPYISGLGTGDTARPTLMRQRRVTDPCMGGLDLAHTTGTTLTRQRMVADSYPTDRRTPSIHLQLLNLPQSLTPMSTTSGTSPASQRKTEYFVESPEAKAHASPHLTKSPSRRVSAGLEMLDGNGRRFILQQGINNEATELPDAPELS